MNLDSSKNLGGIGSILLFLGLFPLPLALGPFSLLIAVVGIVLVLVAMKGFADNYLESSIFNNALYGVIFAIIGAVIAGVIIVVAAVGFLNALGFSISNWTNFTAPQINPQNIDINTIMTFAVSALAALTVIVVFGLVMAVFIRKSLGLLSAKTGVSLFGTTGLIILIGAALTIIVIGLFLLWISLLLLAAAFFSIKMQQKPSSVPSTNSIQT